MPATTLTRPASSRFTRIGRGLTTAIVTTLLITLGFIAFGPVGGVGGFAAGRFIAAICHTVVGALEVAIFNYVATIIALALVIGFLAASR